MSNDQTHAFIVKDTAHPAVSEARITTIQYRAPRFLLAEINTHGLLVKSAASSRAIPVNRRITEVDHFPFTPSSFGKNQKGMQSTTQIAYHAGVQALAIWDEAASDAVKAARALAELEVHKQTANRVLEPYAYVNGVITATEWENFFALRLHKAAQPEFQVLATKIKEALDNSTPVARMEHLPYLLDEEKEKLPPRAKAWHVSGARCARVSYLSLTTGLNSSLFEDADLAARLLEEKHMSPFQHLALPDHVIRDGLDIRWAKPEEHERFWGWISMRGEIEKSMKFPKPRRSSFGKFRSKGGSLGADAPLVLTGDAPK